VHAVIMLHKSKANSGRIAV